MSVASSGAADARMHQLAHCAGWKAGWLLTLWLFAVVIVAVVVIATRPHTRELGRSTTVRGATCEWLKLRGLSALSALLS